MLLRLKLLKDPTLVVNENNDNNMWNTNETYSFIYSAQSIDLANWKVLHPFEMDVTRFWGGSPLRLVIYEQETFDKEQTTIKPEEKKNYVFELQLDYMKLSSSCHSDDNNTKVTHPTRRGYVNKLKPLPV